MSGSAIAKSAEKCKAKSPVASKKFDMRDAVACELSFEKCAGGFRLGCCCDDSMECADLQSLCEAICERNCICCCVRDGVEVCNFNLCCGQCKCEGTKDGCCITCSSSKCCDTLQAICDCLECCCQDGC